MRRADTTTETYQRSFRGRHSIGVGSTGGQREHYTRCACGWRIVGIYTERDRRLAAELHTWHLENVARNA